MMTDDKWRFENGNHETCSTSVSNTVHYFQPVQDSDLDNPHSETNDINSTSL